MTSVAGAEPGLVDLNIYQGDDTAMVFVVDPAELDLTGAVASAQVRRYLGHTTAVSLDCSVDVAANSISVNVVAAVAASLTPGANVWDLQIVRNGAIRTLFAGAANVRAEVTTP